MCWSDRAFTLFEVLLAIVIVGCLAGAIAGMLVAAFKIEDISRVESDLGTEFAVGLSRLMSDLRDAARLYECTSTSVGLTHWAGLMVGTPKGVFLFDWRNHRWLERNGGVIRTAIRSIFGEETGLILAGGADGCIYKTTDCGRSWERVSVGSGAIVGIARASDGTLFCLQESPPAVYRSSDDGATWVSCAPLPDAPSNAHALICRKDSVIVGTDWNGYGNIYYSDDGGASWLVASAVYVPPNMWMYCRAVDIQNNSSQNLTDYQVRIEVPFAQGKMRPDFGDIRFKRRLRPTDPDLPYWLEYYDSKRAIFWVKMPSLPAKSTTRIWLLYGNPDLASDSSFTDTMEAAYSVYKVSYDWVDRPDNNPWLTGLFVYRNLTLPFRFPFYGTFYGDCHITTTGYIRFPAGNYAVDRTATEEELARRCMFAAYWGSFSGRHTYDGPGNKDIRYPGVYVYSYSDRVHVEWEVARVTWWFGRWVPVGGTIHQAFLYRNGDILFQMKFRYNTRGLAGISKGDGTTYIDTTSLLGDGVSLLYAQRKYVEPEPTARVGEPERLQLTRIVWARYE
ncbi:MAG: hypothetical protein DRP82_06420 [Planctomycetota bacterium]|nr:MAG: hypothetical protein DRP82_06420 [Planctomycetota bacterium]